MPGTLKRSALCVLCELCALCGRNDSVARDSRRRATRSTTKLTKSTKDAQRLLTREFLVSIRMKVALKLAYLGENYVGFSASRIR